MKQIIALLLFAFILVSCANGRYPYPKSDLSAEHWQSQVDTSPTSWAQGASPWFRAGGKTPPEMREEKSLTDNSLSETVVKVKDFNCIKIEGDFYVQLVGSKDTGHVTIIGPNDAARSISVRANNGVLYVRQVGKHPQFIKRVKVIIPVNELKVLEHHGDGNVEGIKLVSKGMTVTNSGQGCVFLGGDLNVKCVDVRGQGSVTIFTIESYGTEIKSSGSGFVNIYGSRQILLRSIKHTGLADINVINATSNGLVINAKGKGKIGIKGRVNIREIRAEDEMCVFVLSSSSAQPCIYISGNAKVGIDGQAGALYVYGSGKSFFWGKDLVANELYVRTSGYAHANVMATEKAWANALDYSTIYYYGDPMILSAFEKGSGTVITLGDPQPVSYKRRHRDYKGEYRDYKGEL